ncbi:unnamed protein product [Prunus armeniaca]|uniref:Cornichon family protein n=1 Tax=Prunus armeniaca TaxID=36596 RepID=A0A6J5WJJ0_PRUAR|nr:unnamed protein product [Prunus armeniaca]
MEMLWTWLLSFFFILALLCILGYQLVCLVDLEFDYINPYDSSSRINSVILPEFIIQGVLCLILLIARHWFMLLLALPHLYYNVNLVSLFDTNMILPSPLISSLMVVMKKIHIVEKYFGSLE